MKLGRPLELSEILQSLLSTTISILAAYLSLVLQIFLLLLSHDLQLFPHLDLPQPLGLFGLATFTFLLLLAQCVESRAGIFHLKPETICQTLNYIEHLDTDQIWSL